MSNQIFDNADAHVGSASTVQVFFARRPGRYPSLARVVSELDYLADHWRDLVERGRAHESVGDGEGFKLAIRVRASMKREAFNKLVVQLKEKIADALRRGTDLR